MTFRAVLGTALTLWIVGVRSASLAAEPVDYLRDVKPVLASRCYACHGGLEQKAGLRVDTAALIRAGGDNGPAIVPGKSDESPLIERVIGRGGLKRMPPPSEGEPLTAQQVARLKAWIDEGAGGPANEKPEADPKEHWAFRTPLKPTLPRVHSSPRNPIDLFLATEHEKRGLVPQPIADKRTLLRRVYLDLVGLPPTPEQQQAFLDDPAPDAYAKVVDRLLTSPQYGERWGRHWMDIWRYSDWWGLGAEVRNSQKHIWHWRDWIIESLNTDKGYDQMLREMLAADELYPTDLDKLRATGYLARHYFKFNRNSWLDEVIEHTSKAFLGLTLNCARCHDHKYDPVKQQDYYRLRAIFEPYQVRTDQLPGETDFEKDGLPRAFDCNLDAPTYLYIRGDDKQPVKDRPLMPGLPTILALGPFDVQPVSLPTEAHNPALRPFVLSDHLTAAERQVTAARTALEKAPPNGPARVLAEKTLAAAEALPIAVRARAAADLARHRRERDADDKGRDAALAERRAAVARAEEDVARAELELNQAPKKPDGEKKLATARDNLVKARKALETPGTAYTPLRGSLKTLESNLESESSRSKPFPTTSTGRRSAFARWLTDPRHPLTARVAVNHIWVRHFGRPLVATLFDFGRKGAAPSHPELLDYLAVDLVENGWSMKHLHRLIVTSDAYRRTSSAAGASSANMASDPENRHYWRMNPVRMEAQVVRDSLLYLGGDLDLRLGGPSVHPTRVEASRRRSLYFVHSHNDHHKFLAMFDDANVLECYRRAESIVPQQALALSNSKLALETAGKIASRLGTIASDAEFIRAAFAVVLSGTPTAAEQVECERALAQLTAILKEPKLADAVQRARADLVHALLNHNDFITVR